MAWVLAASATYAVTFVLLAPVLGPPVMLLLLLPAALAGWWLGALRGSLAAVALVMLNEALVLAAGDTRSIEMGGLPGMLPGGVAAVAAAFVMGVLRRRQGLLELARQRLQEQLAKSERLAAALGASEERFRTLAEAALVGVYLIQDGLFRYVNGAFAEAFGYQTEEIIGVLGPLDLTVPDDRALVRSNIETREEGASQRYRFRGLRKDGSLVPVESFGRALTLGGRRTILGTLQDRTREEADEAELRLHLSALESAPVGIVITTPEGIIEWANPHAASLTGYTPDEMRGQHTRLFRSGRHGRDLYRELWETVTAGEVWSGELVNRRKDGSEYREHMSITPVPGADGKVAHFVAVKQDVTRRRADEQRILDLNASLETQLERLRALHAIDTLITGDFELHAALARFVDIAHATLGVDALWLSLHRADSETAEFVEMRGWHQPHEPTYRLPVTSTLVGQAGGDARSQVLRGRKAIAERFPEDARLLREGFEVFGAAPMVARGTLRGGLAFAHRSAHPVEPDFLAIVEALATQGAILIENAGLVTDLRSSNEELRGAYEATIEGWSRALDLRDKETEGHSRRVTELTLRLARAMGLPEEALLHIRRGALLHDIGKMGVPDAILQKPGALTEEEWRIMKRHTTFARDLLAPIAFLGPALEIPYAHHERWDGSGYPEGLEGEAIPLAARIFAVADVYDALASDRPYRRAWTREQASEHIRAGAGSQFDPSVVATFLAMQRDEAG